MSYAGKPGLIIKVHNIIILQIKVGGGGGRGSHLRAIRRPRIHSHIIVTPTPQYMIILRKGLTLTFIAALSKLSWPKCNHAILNANFTRRVDCSVEHTLLVQRMCHNANLALKQNPLQRWGCCSSSNAKYQLGLVASVKFLAQNWVGRSGKVKIRNMSRSLYAIRLIKFTPPCK